MKRRANLVLVIVAMLGLLVLCGPAWAIEVNEPIAHWKFDEGSGATAYDFVGGNVGTIYGDAVWTAGQIDGALSFDGDWDYVDCGNTFASVTGSTTKTITAWAKSDTADYSGQAAGNGRIITLYRESGYSGFSMLAKGSPATWQGLYAIAGNLYNHIDSGLSVTANEWTHIVLVQDGAGVYIYINGVLANSSSDGAAPTMRRFVNADIGAYDGEHGDIKCFFEGAVDELMIFDRALSAEEIEELYRGQLLSLEIVGPAEVAENSQVSYKAIAHYDIGSPKDVTNSADWSVEPNAIASIDSNGLLTTEEIYILEEDITIYAQYTEDTNTFEAEKLVSVLAICPTGTALGFDGVNDYVDVGSAPSLEPSSFTISAWIKPEDVSSRQQIAGKLGNEPVHNRGYGYSLEVLDGKASLLIDPAGCCNGNPIKSETSLEVGKWYFVAGTYDGSTGTIYVDGQPENSDSWTLGAYYTNFYIGARRSDYHSAFYDHFSGVIDEVRVYDRALSPEEIQANMHILLSGDEPNLVGYWGFGEGEGQVAYDLSGSSNNGYLGSDPCDVDSADPAWVESDAPIVICTTGGLIERNITRALESKQRALEEIEAALANENATIGVLEALFRSRDYGNLDKNDIVKAKQEIRSAVQNEQRSTDTLEKSIEKLEDSLSVLGYEVEPNGSNN